MKYELILVSMIRQQQHSIGRYIQRRVVSRQVQLGNETRKLNATKIAQDRSAKDGKLLHLLLQNSAKASNSTSFCNLHIKISLIMNLQVSILGMYNLLKSTSLIIMLLSVIQIIAHQGNKSDFYNSESPIRNYLNQ